MELDLDNWEKLPTQGRVYHNNFHKIIMHSAGLGGGKTHGLCRKLIKLSALNQGMPGAVLCPTYKDFRRDVKPEMFFILEEKMGLREKKHFWFHRSFSEFTFAWNKKPLYVLSGETPIAGPNLAYCGINEFSLISYDRIKEMLRRVRLKEAAYPQRVFAGTPEDVHGWLEEFVEIQTKEEEKRPGTFKLYTSDTKENTHISDDYRQDLETMLDSQALKVFASGQIIRLGGDYYYYAYDDQENVRECSYNKNELIFIGMDFNVGRMTASFAHKYQGLQRPRFEFFDEICIQGNSDTHQLAKAIANRYPPEMCMIRCDSSGKSRKTSGESDIMILKKYFPKQNLAHRNANPRHRKRQLLMNSMFEKGDIVIDPKCTGLRKDFKKVEQNKVDFSKSKKNEELTHFSDGADYLIDWEVNFNIPKATYRRN